jgi:hypothetical protein
MTGFEMATQTRICFKNLNLIAPSIRPQAARPNWDGCFELRQLDQGIRQYDSLESSQSSPVLADGLRNSTPEGFTDAGIVARDDSPLMFKPDIHGGPSFL